MWREGCIIRAQFLERIKETYDANHALANLLLAPYFQEAIDSQPGSLAQGGGRRRDPRHPGSGVQQRAGVL